MVIAIAVPVINFLFRHVVAERIGIILLSAIIAHSGWHWMTDRGAELFAYSFQWPAMNYAFWASVMRWLMLLLVVGAVLWGLIRVYDRFQDPAGSRELSQSPDSG